MIDALKLLWRDACTVRRTGASFACRISRASRARSYTEYADLNTQESGFVLYCSPEEDVKAGDFLEILRDSRVFRGYAARPMPYKSHLEVGLIDVEAV